MNVPVKDGGRETHSRIGARTASADPRLPSRDVFREPGSELLAHELTDARSFRKDGLLIAFADLSGLMWDRMRNEAVRGEAIARRDREAPPIMQAVIAVPFTAVSSDKRSSDALLAVVQMGAQEIEWGVTPRYAPARTHG